jgi:hypothetical protein
MRILIILLAFGALACSKNEVENTSPTDYYPLKKGLSLEYEVLEENYGVLSGKVEKKYFLKETVGDSVGKISETPIYKIERYKRQNNNENWKIDSVWTAYRLPDRAVKIENNTPFLKISFPVSDKKSWNGNAYNTLSAENYSLSVLKNAYSLANQSFDKGIEIIQKQDSSAVILLKKKEIYLPNIGLVYKENTNFSYCQSTPNCIGKGIVESGKRVVYKALSFSGN